MPKPQRIALDLSLLLDLALDDETAWDAIEVIRRERAVEFVVPPAVQVALSYAFIRAPKSRVLQQKAAIALSWLKSKWRFEPGHMVPDQLWVSGGNSNALITEGLLKEGAFHAAETISESAALKCEILLSHDPELLDVDYQKLKRFLQKYHRDNLWITFPAALRANLEEA